MRIYASTRARTLQHTATHCNCCNTMVYHTKVHPHAHSAHHCLPTIQSLQHTARYCNTLQHNATHCNALHRTATHCNTLQHTDVPFSFTAADSATATTHCNALQHTATHCNSLQLTATHCNTPARRDIVRINAHTVLIIALPPLVIRTLNSSNIVSSLQGAP